MNKRGLSTIVTSLLLILLVIVAIGIVWVVIRNVLSENVEEISLDKFTTDLEIKQAQVNVDSINIKVKRNTGGGDVVGLKFIFEDGENSEIIEVTQILNALDYETFTFYQTDFGELNVSLITKLSVVPLLKSGTGQVSGNIADVYDIPGSSSGSGTTPETCTITCATGLGCRNGTLANAYDTGDECCGAGDYCYACDSGFSWNSTLGECVSQGTETCSLTSASWNETEVVDGTVVGLNAAGNNCEGVSLNYSIYEEEPFGFKNFVTSFISTSLNSSWIAQWFDEGGTDPDPEYSFTVKVVGESGEVTSGELSVSQILQTCAEMGGQECGEGTSCDVAVVVASDTDYCCLENCVAGCTVTCSSGPGCRSSLADGQVVSGECCGTGSCYDCNTGFSWDGSNCVAELIIIDAEEGDLSEWDSITESAGNTITADASAKYNGDYGFKIIFNGSAGTAYGTKTFTENNESWFRFYIYVPTGFNGADTYNIVNVGDLYDGGSYVGQFGLKTMGSSTVVGWNCRYMYTSLWSSTNFSNDEWHYVEIKYVRDAVNGGVVMYVDGNEIINNTGYDSSSKYVDTLRFGWTDAGDAPTSDDYLYLDDLTIE